MRGWQTLAEQELNDQALLIELSDECLWRKQPVALIDPLGHRLDWGSIGISEIARDPPRSADLPAVWIRRCDLLRRLDSAIKFDHEPQHSVRLFAEEEEALLASLKATVYTRGTFARLGIPKRNLLQLLRHRAVELLFAHGQTLRLASMHRQ